MAKRFKDLTEREILAVGIQLEEEDSRVYGDFAEGLRESYPATAKIFEEMQAEESRHRQALIDMYRKRFGEHIPLIRRQDVKGFIERRPVWLVRPLGIKAVRKQVEEMELETRRFYEQALRQVSDAATRKLLGDLAEIERQHSEFAESLEEKHLDEGARTEEEKAGKRVFMLQIIQPGLAGLMDGSVSTLAPIFAAAFATHQTHDAFLVGAAASLGAGISMAFAEALSDDGIADRPREACDTGTGYGSDDSRRGIWPYAAVPDPELPRGVCRSRGCGRHRTRHHQLGAAPLHGYAAAFVRLSGGGGGSAGICGGNPDWQLVIRRRQNTRDH